MAIVSETPRQPGVQAGVRLAAQADTGPVSQTLARAFFDDPVTVHFFPDETLRRARLPSMFALLFKLGLPYGACYVTEGYESVTLWRPPGQWHLTAWQYLANGPALLSVFGAGALKVMSTMGRIEKLHPKTPHWYLQTIGTDPAKQGKGFGGAIIRSQLAEADRQHAHCYLESSKDTNIPIYQSFGFQITGEIRIPDGPTLWPMWREAPA